MTAKTTHRESIHLLMCYSPNFELRSPQDIRNHKSYIVYYHPLFVVHVKINGCLLWTRDTGEKSVINDTEVSIATCLTINGRIFVSPKDHLDAMVLFVNVLYGVKCVIAMCHIRRWYLIKKDHQTGLVTSLKCLALESWHITLHSSTGISSAPSMRYYLLLFLLLTIYNWNPFLVRATLSRRWSSVLEESEIQLGSLPTALQWDPVLGRYGNLLGQHAGKTGPTSSQIH